ncbi:diacylglycerol kinase family protein [Halioxenophilus aromaticivorans]|uniref:Diacylglycerol kinase family protein n=1 Tax=Halioxenophilus aromaticivorans TaxID=1306992 RepID=A0AAV3TWT7_9ALTE
MGLIAALVPSVWLQIPLVWIGLSLLAVGIAYALNKPGVFRKRSDGTIPLWSRWVFIPFLLGAAAYNTIRKRSDKDPAIQQIANRLYVGARVSGSELSLLDSQNIGAILDVTAEFDALNAEARASQIEYLNIPILDHAVPSQTQLMKALHWIDHQQRQGHNVLVHCALGRGRSVLLVLAFLLATNPKENIPAAIDKVQNIRRKARLNRRQLRYLRKCRDADQLVVRSTLYVIANPKSGGGKWLNQGQYALDRLGKFFTVKECLLTENKSAKDWVQEAKQNRIGIVVACGGDGTLTAVAEQLIGTDIVFGVIPLGTANAVAKTLFGVLEASIDTACDAIIEGHSIEIDTAQCNGKPMLLMAAIGFEQHMIAHSEQVDKDALGQLAYLQGLWEAINENNLLDVTLTLDDGAAQKIETASLVVANLAPFTSVLAQGGGLPVYNDGLLDVTYLKPGCDVTDNAKKLLGLAVSGLRSASGEDVISNTEQVVHEQASKIVIAVGNADDYVIDGEIYNDLPLEINTFPKSLRIITTADDL